MDLEDLRKVFPVHSSIPSSSRTCLLKNMVSETRLIVRESVWSGTTVISMKSSVSGSRGWRRSRTVTTAFSSLDVKILMNLVQPTSVSQVPSFLNKRVSTETSCVLLSYALKMSHCLIVLLFFIKIQCEILFSFVRLMRHIEQQSETVRHRHKTAFHINTNHSIIRTCDP